MIGISKYFVMIHFSEVTHHIEIIRIHISSLERTSPRERLWTDLTNKNYVD